MRTVLRLLPVAAAFLMCAGTGWASQAAPLQVPAQAAAGQGQVSEDEAPLKVALVTYGPGEVYWERFGHNAIVIDDPQAGTRTSYNYGVFDFEEKHFLLNFARGHMRYSIDSEALDEEVAMYAAEGRSVTIQVLSLTPQQARQLATFLEWNAQQENAGYPYDYYLNNCSTKVRDALNRVLGGALERQLAKRPTPYTFRFDTVRLVSPDFWLALGMDAGLGPNADHPLTLWQESFVPMVLSHSLDGITVPGASGELLPLVSEAQVVVAAKLPPVPASPPGHRLAFLACGAGLAALLLWLGRARGRYYRAAFASLAVSWWLICGITGLLFAALWGLTAHWAAFRNENLLLLDPVCLLLPVLWWRAPRIAFRLAVFCAAAALLSLVVRILPGWYQDNLAFIGLAVPVHLALALLARGRLSAAPSTAGGLLTLPEAAL